MWKGSLACCRAATSAEKHAGRASERASGGTQSQNKHSQWGRWCVYSLEARPAVEPLAVGGAVWKEAAATVTDLKRGAPTLDAHHPQRRCTHTETNNTPTFRQSSSWGSFWQPQKQSGPTGHRKTRLKITGVQTNLCTCLAPNLRGIVSNVSHGSQSVRLAWSSAAPASPMEQSIQL